MWLSPNQDDIPLYYIGIGFGGIIAIAIMVGVCLNNLIHREVQVDIKLAAMTPPHETV
jgi:hypothetical protein